MNSRRILLATENQHKLQEFQRGFDPRLFAFCSLKDLKISNPMPPELGATYHENAEAKARWAFGQSQLPSLADDSGFEVEALDGNPGIYSARFMNTKDSTLQCAEILKRMKGLTHRSASFVCVLAFIESAEARVKFFEGRISGRVSEQALGSLGFGYDPIFIPEGYSQTFAQMDSKEKERISHRALALERFHSFLSIA